MKKIITLLFFTATLALFDTDGHAAGFRLPEQNAAAMGMASAFVGQADNASAAWYNPAAITELEGTQMSVGFIGIYPVLTHQNQNGTTDVSDREMHLPFHLYATHKMNNHLAFGIGINNPFGLASDWDPNTSSTRYIATYSQVVTTQVNPNMAFTMGNGLSLAFGIDYLRLSATLEKSVYVVLPGPVILGDHNFRLNGSGYGWGANAALKYKVSNAVNAGFSYRSRIQVDLDGSASLAGGPAAAAGSGSTSITLPDIMQVGLSYKASDNLAVNADIEYTLWSTFDRIVVTSDNPIFNSTDERQWEDVWCLRIGAQYKLSDQWKLRAGYLYDQNPVAESRFETSNPDSDRQGVSIGAGYTFGNMSVDVAYMYVRFNSRTINNSLVDNDANPFTPEDTLNGSYNSVAHMAGITIGYRF